MRTNPHQKSLGDVSNSPTGQGCLWATAIGILLVMAFSYLSTWSGVTGGALDEVDSEIASVSRPHKSKLVSHWHRRRRTHTSAFSE